MICVSTSSVQVFKFGLYVSIPIALSWIVLGDHQVLNAIIRHVRCMRFVYAANTRPPQKSYVVYPPEAPRPPSVEELQELIQAKKDRNK